MRSLVQILSDAYESEVRELRKNEEEHKKERMKINVQFNLLRQYFQTFHSLLCHRLLSLIPFMSHSNSTNFPRPFSSLDYYGATYLPFNSFLLSSLILLLILSPLLSSPMSTIFLITHRTHLTVCVSTPSSTMRP